MNNLSTKPQFVSCPCQNCDGHIEFDASGFQRGETRTVECPHCKLETTLFVPPAASLSVENRNPPPNGNKDIASLRETISKCERSKGNARVMQMIGWGLCLTGCGAVVGIPIIMITGNTVGEADAKRKAAEDDLRVIFEAIEKHEKEQREVAFRATPEYYFQCAAALNLNAKTTPFTVENFIGQDRVKAEIWQAYEAARGIGRRSPHILMVGEKGMGKSTLALLIANISTKSSGTQYKVVDAERINKPADLAGILANLESGDALFIDNIDKLDDEPKNLLKSAIVDFKFNVTLEDEDFEEGHRTVLINLPFFTLIATASKKDELSPLLVAGFPLVVSFDNYSVEEITAITQKLADDLGVKIDADAIQLIGSVAKSPWFVSYLIELVRVYAQARESSERITLGMVTQALNTMAPEDEPNQRREAIPSEVKREVWRRDEGKCANCGSQIRLEYDHIIPVSKGGSNTARNIQLLCEACNRAKSDLIQ